MSLKIRAVAACSATCFALPVLPFGAASAADYDPPIYVEEAPEFVPVEVGSGWYLRGDIGYNAGKPAYDLPFAGVDHNRFGGGIGFGYHFTDNFRADLTVSHLGKDEFAYTTPANAAIGSHSAWSGLVSGYFDIATVVGITPYVGAGLGVVYSRNEVVASLAGHPESPRSFNDRSYDFAYALMAGASYKMTDNVSVDLGYQFLHTPDAPYMDPTTLVMSEGSKQHLVRLGLRYDLW